MDIVVILLLVLDVILYIYFVNCLDEITYKHNATIYLINSLNKRIGDIEKERDETKGTN